MGSPVLSLLPTWLWSICGSLVSYDVTLPFWKRYWMMLATDIPSDRVRNLLQHLNSTESSIQITEDDGTLPFLDVDY